jgi:site-specific recombinase XerD
LTGAQSGRVVKESTMNKSEQKHFDELYYKHLRALKLQGMSDKTIDAYSRAVRRISAWFDCCPDRLEPEQLAGYFSELVESHSWSTVKLDRCGLQFFYKHVLERDWQWVKMIRAPKIRSQTSSAISR